MFASKSKSSFEETAPAATSIIGAGTVITGDIQSNGDIRIDGLLIGNLSAAAKILIGNAGEVRGNVTGKYADIQGKVVGDIKVADLLLLRDKANVEGDVFAGKLQVEPSVTFNGHCHMGANIVELNKELPNAVNQ